MLLSGSGRPYGRQRDEASGEPNNLLACHSQDGMAMKVVRAARRKQFESIPHALLMDQRLSYRARGVAVRLLANMDGFQMSSSDLARQSPTEGRQSVLAALLELRVCGYLTVERCQDARGRWRTTVTISDEPSLVSTEVRLPDFGSPDSGRPASGSPRFGAPRDGDPKSGLPGSGQSDSKSIKPNTNTKPTTVSRCAGEELELPPVLLEHATEVAKVLSELSVETQQQLLDELSGALTSNNPPRRPMAWLRAVAMRARQGEFTPDLALVVHAERRRRAAFAEEAKVRLEAVAVAAARRLDPEVRARGILAMQAAAASLKDPDRVGG